MSLAWTVLALMAVACGVVVLLAVRRNSLRADDAAWVEQPAPATSFDEHFDEHFDTARALLEETAGTDASVADEAEQFLRDLANLNHRKES